jgi:hypothetical protein
MENFNAFYRMLNGDLGPVTNTMTRQHYLDFLKKRFQDYDRYLTISLIKKNGAYHIKEQRETSFCEILPVSQEENPLKENHSALNFICRELDISTGAIRQCCVAEYEQYASLELMVSDKYENLSEHQAKFYYYQVFCDETVAEIKEKMTSSILEQKENQIKSFIQKYQALVNGYVQTLLLDLIPSQEHNSLFQLSEKYTTTDVYKIIYQSLDDILHFLEKSFGKYLDTSFPVPYKSRLLIADIHSNRLSEVLNHFEWSNLDYVLHDIVITPFHRLGKLEPITITYQHQQYDLAYLQAFHEAVVDEKPLDHKGVLMILWCMNYNSLKFFNYLTSQISRELKTLDSIGEKLEKLYYYQKLGNQLPMKTEFSYNYQLLPLKKQMAIWLQEEISYQKKKAKYSHYGFLAEIENDKRQLKMSVAQLSLFVRAFFETGLVDGTRHELLQFITRHYRTDQQETISFGSLKGKYYKVDTGTKRAVGRMMKRMLAHIENAGKVT